MVKEKKYHLNKSFDGVAPCHDTNVRAHDMKKKYKKYIWTQSYLNVHSYLLYLLSNVITFLLKSGYFMGTHLFGPLNTLHMKQPGREEPAQSFKGALCSFSGTNLNQKRKLIFDRQTE